MADQLTSCELFLAFSVSCLIQVLIVRPSNQPPRIITHRLMLWLHVGFHKLVWACLCQATLMAG